MLGAWLAIKLLRWGKLSNESRQLLTACMLEQLGALPVRAKITFDETGKVLIEGKYLSVDRAMKLRVAAQAMQRNFAYRLVQENVKFLAVKIGVHQNTSPDQGLFAKAALWQHSEERELYARLAQSEVEE